MDWATVELALWTWVKDASGLDAANVIWSDQGGHRPTGNPFITLKIGDVVALGAADELRQEYDAGANAGEEIVFTSTGHREFSLSIQVFGDVVGATSSRAVAFAVQSSLGLPSVRGALVEAGLSPFDSGQIQNVTAIKDAAFEGRHVLNVRFYVADAVTEATGYIETVEVTDSSTETVSELPLD